MFFLVDSTTQPSLNLTFDLNLKDLACLKLLIATILSQSLICLVLIGTLSFIKSVKLVVFMGFSRFFFRTFNPFRYVVILVSIHIATLAFFITFFFKCLTSSFFGFFLSGDKSRCVEEGDG